MIDFPHILKYNFRFKKYFGNESCPFRNSRCFCLYTYHLNQRKSPRKLSDHKLWRISSQGQLRFLQLKLKSVYPVGLYCFMVDILDFNVEIHLNLIIRNVITPRISYKLYIELRKWQDESTDTVCIIQEQEGVVLMWTTLTNRLYLKKCTYYCGI